MATSWHISRHDGLPPPQAQVVDEGLGAFNDRAAPLHEVRALSCFAHDAQGRVVGGAVGRVWGPCGELQQLWVDEAWRRQGLGSALLQAFEAQAREAGCASIHLETFSFQAPALYARLGYAVEYTRRDFPHGIVKVHMLKQLGDAAGVIPEPGPR